MIARREGLVVKIFRQEAGVAEILVETAGKTSPAINFDAMTGLVKIGDRVLVNTTAVDLNLGSGGYYFVMANLSAVGEESASGPGHIIKLRYTPSQARVLSVEEQDSPNHEAMLDPNPLPGTPVICCTLHSMLSAAAAGVKAVDRNLRLVYVMTDGGALPLALSRTVPMLRRKALLDGSVTAGHAFGGDLEAVSVHSGILAAVRVLGADVVVVGMGPGIVGTGTPFGFTGIEQAEVVHASAAVGGRPVAVPRISFADRRERHRGLSHHSRTALGKATFVTAVVALPCLPAQEDAFVRGQMHECGIFDRHLVASEDGNAGLGLLREMEIETTTMGRSIREDPEFFLTAAAAGSIAAKMARGMEIVTGEGTHGET